MAAACPLRQQRFKCVLSLCGSDSGKSILNLSNHIMNTLLAWKSSSCESGRVAIGCEVTGPRKNFFNEIMTKW
jgi:hypothetical protein